jgi:LAO/AO transport system kinase
MNRDGGPSNVNSEQDLARAIRAKDRRAFARAITLVESTRQTDQSAAEALLTGLLPDTGGSIRIGISGAPGVGKSTFIEAFGKLLSADGRRIAVFAIDPSSRRSGGSILGDKTRMEKLARDPNAFIRPSPAGTTLGGVARRTRESMLLAEAAQFDVVLVETVGIGQSETSVADMTDIFVVLVAPGGGDDLQGIKRGVMELADLVVVTKADGDLEATARRTEADYQMAMQLMRSRHEGLATKVMSVSSLTGRRVADVWTTLKSIHEMLSGDGRLSRLRQEQSRRWFWNEIQTVVSETILSDADLAREAAALEVSVAQGVTLPSAAARKLVMALR